MALPSQISKQSTGAAPVQSHAHITICLLIIIFRPDISGSWNSRIKSYTRNHPWKCPVFIPCHINLLVARTVTIKKLWDRHWRYLQRSAVVAWQSQTSFPLECSRVGYYSITVNAYCVCSWINYQCANWRIKPTRWHLLLYYTSYRLNMFRALLCPSSGARDYNVDYHTGRFVLGLL